MVFSLILLVCFVAVCGLAVAAAASDVLRLKIPNALAIAIAGLFVPAAAAAHLAQAEVFPSLWSHGLAAGVMLLVTVPMFLTGMMGGGDSKLAAALALWLGLRGLLPFIFFMAICGGLLGVAALVIKKKKLRFARAPAGGWLATLAEGKSAVPYGVAISFGAIMSFLMTGFAGEILSSVTKFLNN